MVIQSIKEGLQAYCELRETTFGFRQIPVAKKDQDEIRAKAKFSVAGEIFVVIETYDDEFSVREDSVSGSEILKDLSLNSIYPELLAHITGRTFYLNALSNSGDALLIFDDSQSIEALPVMSGDHVDLNSLPSFKYLFDMDSEYMVEREVLLFLSSHFHPSAFDVKCIQEHTLQFSYGVLNKKYNMYDTIKFHFKFPG